MSDTHHLMDLVLRAFVERESWKQAHFTLGKIVSIRLAVSGMLLSHCIVFCNQLRLSRNCGTVL